MIILELEDFDVAAELASLLENKVIDETAYIPMFVYIIDWANHRNYLDSEFKNTEVFKKNYQALQESKIDMATFLFRVLDSKLLDDYFVFDERQFVRDYIEYEGYEEDLKIFFKTQPYYFPASLDYSTQINQLIDQSRLNYLENKKNFPDLIVFYDPEVLKKERLIHEEEKNGSSQKPESDHNCF